MYLTILLRIKKVTYNTKYNILCFKNKQFVESIFFVALRPNAGHGFLILEVSR